MTGKKIFVFGIVLIMLSSFVSAATVVDTVDVTYTNNCDNCEGSEFGYKFVAKADSYLDEIRVNAHSDTNVMQIYYVSNGSLWFSKTNSSIAEHDAGGVVSFASRTQANRLLVAGTYYYVTGDRPGESYDVGYEGKNAGECSSFPHTGTNINITSQVRKTGAFSVDNCANIDSIVTTTVPIVVAATGNVSTINNATAYETRANKYELQLTAMNVSNSSYKTQLVLRDQVYTAAINWTNGSHVRFYVPNARPPLVDNNPETMKFYWNFSIAHENGSTLKDNTTNLSQSIYWGYKIDHIVLFNTSENKTMNVTVNVTSEGQADLKLNFFYDNSFWAQFGSNNTVNNGFLMHFPIGTPHTYLNDTKQIANVTLNITYSGKTKQRQVDTNFHYISWNLTKHPRINITARDSLNGLLLNNFTTINGKQISTTSSTVLFWENGFGVYEIGVNNTVFELKKRNFTLNATHPFQHYTFQLYTTNSFNFTFKDERSDELVQQNISIEFVGDDASYTFVAQNGSLYVDLLVPSNYTIRYRTNSEIAGSSGNIDYGLIRSYIIKLTDRSHNDLQLYLLQNSNSTDTKVTVFDQNTLQGIEGAAIYVQRYFLGDNAFRTVAMCSTDIAGECHVDLEHNNELYKFSVDSPWLSNRLVTEDFYVTSATLNLYVNLFATLGENTFDREGITGRISYHSSVPTFKVTYSDSENAATEYCIDLKTYGQYAKILLNTTCSASPSGTLEVTGFQADKTNYAVFRATLDGEPQIIQTYWKSLDTDKLPASKAGVFYTALIFMFMAFLSVVHVFAVVLASVGLVFAYLLGILVIDITWLVLIVASSIILAIIIEMKK